MWGPALVSRPSFISLYAAWTRLSIGQVLLRVHKRHAEAPSLSPNSHMLGASCLGLREEPVDDRVDQLTLSHLFSFIHLGFC